MRKNKRAAGAATPTAREVETDRRRSIVKIIALIFMAVTMMSLCWPKSRHYEEHCFTVGQGETLWEIGAKAKELGDPRDIREIIHYIVKDNGLGEFIYPGQQIKVNVEVPK